MSAHASPEELGAAEAYEQLFVRALFGEWAPRVAAAADTEPGQRVLDVACGTGVLARTIAELDGARVVGIDPSRGMLGVAERLAPEVEFVLGAAEELPFADDSFDVVVSQFGLMFFTDRASAIVEMLRVLAPGGRLAVAVWGTLASMPPYEKLVGILDRVAGPRAGDALRAPFVLGDAAELEALFSTAGTAGLAIDTQHGRARFPSATVMVEADLRGWLPAVGVDLTEAQIDAIISEAEAALADHVTPEGTVEFTTTAHVVTATASPVSAGAGSAT